MYIILWIIFGGIIGWLASILTHNNQRMGIITNIVVGIVGAFIGGFIAYLFNLAPLNIFSFWGMGFALLGAVILLLIINLIRGNRR